MYLVNHSRVIFDSYTKEAIWHLVPQCSRSVLSNPQKYQCDSMGLHGFFYHPAIKQADYLLLYEQNWLKEGTEALVLKKTAESSK